MRNLIAADGRPWVLGGGTALAERFQHRDSEDLDFFLDQDFDADELANWLAAHGLLVTKVAPNTITAYLDTTKVEFLGVPKLVQLEEPTLIRGIRVQSPRDILATRIHAISRRAKLRDYVDLMVADQTGTLPLEAVLEASFLKYNVVNRSNIVDQTRRALLYLDDVLDEPIANYSRDAVAQYWVDRFRKQPLTGFHKLRSTTSSVAFDFLRPERG